MKKLSSTFLVSVSLLGMINAAVLMPNTPRGQIINPDNLVCPACAKKPAKVVGQIVRGSATEPLDFGNDSDSDSETKN